MNELASGHQIPYEATDDSSDEEGNSGAQVKYSQLLQENEAAQAARASQLEQSHLQQQNPDKKILQKYMKAAFSEGGRTPLPILNHIHNGYLPLINYNINKANVSSIAQIIPTIIPHLLKKLYFVNNGLKGEDTAALVEAISRSEGLE